MFSNRNIKNNPIENILDELAWSAHTIYDFSVILIASSELNDENRYCLFLNIMKNVLSSSFDSNSLRFIQCIMGLDYECLCGS